MMLHVHGVVHRLGKTTSDGLSDSKKAIEKLRSEKRVMNEVVPDAIDVRIHHQRINEPKNQHHPKRRVRKQKVEAEKISEMKKPRRGWNCIPACVREELGVRRSTFYSDRVSGHHRSALIFVEIRQTRKCSGASPGELLREYLPCRQREDSALEI